MKKTITLTFLMLVLSLISDLFMLKDSNKLGGLMSQSYAEKNIPNILVYDSLKNVKKELEDSILLAKNVISNEIKIVEKIETNVLYKEVIGTVYHAEVRQTDDTPLITADMSYIDTTVVNDLRWVALSRDLLKRTYYDRHGRKQVWRGKIKLGDTIWIDYDKKNLWKISHANLKPNDSISAKKCLKKYEKMKEKYEQVKGYWIVHDVMGIKYTKRNRSGDYILDANGNKQVVYIHHAIDFLQHPTSGMMDVWNRNLIITKRKVSYITLNTAQQVAVK